MPNLRLASRVATRRAKQPTRLERFRSSLSIWQVALAILGAGIALALAGVVTHRLKGRAHGADDADNEGRGAGPSSASADTDSDSATGGDSDTVPANESPLAERVQDEMFHRSDAVRPDA